MTRRKSVALFLWPVTHNYTEIRDCNSELHVNYSFTTIYIKVIK